MIKLTVEKTAKGTSADVEIAGYRTDLIEELSYAVASVIKQLDINEDTLDDFIAAFAVQVFHDTLRPYEEYEGNKVVIDAKKIEHGRRSGNE